MRIMPLPNHIAYGSCCTECFDQSNAPAGHARQELLCKDACYRIGKCRTHGITPQTLQLLNEFSCLAFDLIRGMDGTARRPLADAYWQRADPLECTGAGADSFAAFNRRISAFLDHYPQLEDGSLLFGHGIWIGLLAWRLLGFRAETSADMSAFRRFQSGLPMPNTAVWQLSGNTRDDLRLRFLSPKTA